MRALALLVAVLLAATCSAVHTHFLNKASQLEGRLSVPRAHAAVANVTIKSCNSPNCSAATCQASSFPSGVCVGGGIYTCKSSLAQCIDVVQYNAGNGVCNNATSLGPASFVCDFCYSLPNENGTALRHFIARNCKSDQARTMYEECDSKCNTCNKTFHVPLGKCFAAPMEPTEGSFTATGIRPCNKVMQLRVFDTYNCTGPSTENTAVAANFCFGGGNSSNYFGCN